ncbi:hypothetical protein [Tabrizicola fusiformis]|uniref:hypothetical protein n=1 Tax=Tabrizicola sp. SY72 TaxID=2741673 RepID=UPI001571A02A|nr:hypothetical protein [Tabrizicola sp. SY72]NTT87831.1 hypothetical protein [Tabrizicola sp. SY72]
MPIVSTGSITITDVADGLNIVLSQGSHIVATDAAGAGGDFGGASTTVYVMVGSYDDTASWTISANASPGVIGNLVGRVYAVSAMTVDTGYVDLTVSRAGYPSMVARFNVSKARQGVVGPGLSLTASAAGFTFTDGVALPATQTIAVRALRQGADYPVLFFASNGAQLETDTAALTAEGAAFGIPIAGDGETCYIDLADFGAADQMYVTAICGEATAVLHLARINYSTAEPGATRNVFRGAHTVGTIYTPGDQVIYQGSGWACRVWHTAAPGNLPPALPTTQNTWWTQSAVIGDTGPQGERGTKQAATATAGTVWSDSEANAAIAAAGWGTPINGDVVTLYNSAAGFSQTRVRAAGVWSALAAFFGGNVLVDGTVEGKHIKAGTITASRLILGDTSNMVPDPDMMDATLYSGAGLTAGVHYSFEANISADMMPTQSRILLTAGLVGEVLTRAFPIVAGAVLNVSCYVRANGSGSCTPRLYAHFYSDVAATTEVGSPVLIGTNNSTTFARLAANVTVPATAIQMRLGFAQETVGSTRQPRFTFPVVRLVATGELLGAVTTDKLAMSGTNLIANADFATGDFTNWRRWDSALNFQAVIPAVTAGVPVGAPTANVATFFGSATNISTFAAVAAFSDPGAGQDGFAVAPGEQYVVSLTAAKQASPALAVTMFHVRVFFFTSAGTYSATPIDVIPGIQASLTTGWQTFSGAFTVPADATRCWVQVRANGLTAGAIYWTNLSAQKMLTGGGLVDGFLEARHVRTGTLSADMIGVGRLSAEHLSVDDLLELDAQTAGFAIGKKNISDTGNDGIFMGRSALSGGGTGFGLYVGVDEGGVERSILATQETLRITNAQFLNNTASLPTPVSVTTSQTISLPANSKKLSLSILGGGAGGSTGKQGVDIALFPPTAGGDTVVQLYDGATYTGVSWTAAGAVASQQNREGNTGYAGKSSPYGTGGAGGVYDGARDGSPGAGQGSGGGGGASYDAGFGGLAAALVSVVDYDVSTLTSPKLVVSIGAGGAGGYSTVHTYGWGGAGAGGLLQYTVINEVPLRASVIPWEPTAFGTFSKPANTTGYVFPDLGPGLWVISSNDSNAMGLGNVQVNDSGQNIFIYQDTSATFVASVRPYIPSGGSANSRTIRYQFYAMR